MKINFKNDLYALRNDGDYVYGIRERYSQSDIKKKEMLIKI